MTAPSRTLISDSTLPALVISALFHAENGCRKIIDKGATFFLCPEIKKLLSRRQGNEARHHENTNMKTETATVLREIRSAIQRKFYLLSNKAVDYVVTKLAEVKTFEIEHAASTARRAQQYADDHGGKGSDHAELALAELAALSPDQLAAWAKRVNLFMIAESALLTAQHEMACAAASLQGWVDAGRPTAEQEHAATIARAEAYWESEGKYEEELEERGEAPYFDEA